MYIFPLVFQYLLHRWLWRGPPYYGQYLSFCTGSLSQPPVHLSNLLTTAPLTHARPARRDWSLACSGSGSSWPPGPWAWRPPPSQCPPPSAPPPRPTTPWTAQGSPGTLPSRRPGTGAPCGTANGSERRRGSCCGAASRRLGHGRQMCPRRPAPPRSRGGPCETGGPLPAPPAPSGTPAAGTCHSGGGTLTRVNTFCICIGIKQQLHNRRPLRPKLTQEHSFYLSPSIKPGLLLLLVVEVLLLWHKRWLLIH